MTQISILGCGWLGLPLAKALLENGFLVNGSTTSEGKLLTLKNSGVQPFLIALESKSISGEMESFLKESKILIIDIPPKLRGDSKENFVGKIRTLIPYIENSTIENVIFISSTSVYGDTSPAEFNVTEETEPHPVTESGKQLLQAEQLLQNNASFKTTTLRFGGLVGEDRHPIKSLAGKKNIENPKAPINLIHQKDCIGIILKIIEKKSWNETFNAAAPFHQSREEYYMKKAVELNLALPEFNYELPTFGKLILSTKLETVLDYTFVITANL